MLSRFSTRGFTLIELLVAMTIIGVMVAMAMPSFGTMIQNGRLASASKSYVTGLQLARTEAIRRNTPVEFVLTNTPAASGIETAAVATPTGQNWVVRAGDGSASAPFQLIESKSALDVSGQIGAASVQVAGAASGAPFTGRIGFDGFGATPLSVTLDISSPAGGSCAPAGPMRCQQVQVRAGGRIGICDPNAVAGDSRRCAPP